MKSKEAQACSFSKCEMGGTIQSGQDFMNDATGETGGAFHLFCFDKFVDAGRPAKFLIKKKAPPQAAGAAGISDPASPTAILIPLQAIADAAKILADAYLKNPTFREIEPVSMRDVVGRHDTDIWARKVLECVDDWKIVFGQK